MWVMGWAHENGAGVPRNYAKALAWYRRGEALNDTESIASIGWLHDNGFGVPRDKTKACDYYERASKDGDGGGTLNNLGWCFATGEGRPLDLQRAKTLYEQAIATGDDHAARNLAHMYKTGRGVPADKTKAEQLYRLSAERGLPQGMADYAFHIKDDGPAAAKTSCDWFERAAQRHHARAMNNLAVCYIADNGPRPKNLATAIGWYERAAALNDGLALRNLGDLYLSGTGVTKNETTALAYFKRGADAGDAGSMLEYGMMLTRGQATTPDAAAGCDWFEKAAKADDSRAMNNIGACFANGEGRSQDVAQGISWYEKAMAAGDTLALVNLGDLYANGRGVTRDTKRAVDLFKRSAERGHPAGAVEYAAALFHGNGVDKDAIAACNWFEKAAQQNHPTGLNGLGVCVENGYGRKRDLKASMGWFAKAAEAGSLTALRNLVRYHDRGIAGSKNPEAAADWMRKAFERGHDSLLNDVISYPSSWSRDSRRALQKGLKRDGVYDGPVDGYMSASLDTALWSKLAPAAKSRLTQEFVWAPIDGAPKGLLIRVCKSADAGNGQRPLVVINHGLTTDDSERRDMRPMSCGAIAGFFTQRGYTVAIPLRRGYGETAGRFTEGGTRVCATSPDFVAPGLAIATDIQAAVTHMKTRADIAPSGTIVLGHSGGGWGALALASRNAPGVAGIVNISGVHGSNRNRPEGVCGPDPITKSTRTFGRTARTPSLWIYGENDSHAGVKLVRRMFDGYRQGGASATLHFLPANDTDGHNIFDDDSFDAWSTLVDEWLTTLK
jgi:TPR repeat protein/dienelactone hydrolase